MENNHKKNIMKKSEGFILILVLFILYLVQDQDEYPKIIDSFANHLFGHIDSLERQNKVLFNVVDSLLENKDNADILLEKICTSIIEDSIEASELAKGYHCLANLERKKNDPTAIYRAIRNESYALEAFYEEKYAKNLLAIMNQGHDQEISLEQLSKSNDPELRSRAFYRMSLINSLGRASSLEEPNYNLEMAVNLRNKVLQEIKTPKKSIDVMFSLNNQAKYIQYAKATISSILLNADLDSHYNFYIIMDSEDPLSEINKSTLSNLQNIGSYKIAFKILPRELFANQNNFADLKTRILFSRFLAENLFPELDSIVSLDVDIIVLRDLYNLQHQQDLENFALAGVAEGQKTQDRVLCKFPYTYINAGVIVQNLKLMRTINHSSLMLNKYQDIKSSMPSRCLYMLDQDVINLLYEDKIKFISKRWNYIPILNYSTKLMPFIIHYAGKKPWVYNNLPSKYLKILNTKYHDLAQTRFNINR